jgi:excisionase family DNA binding protein
VVVVSSPITPLLTADELAELLRLSRAQVYALKHEIGFVRLGRSIRFDQSSVDAFLSRHREGDSQTIARIDVRAL